jgi:hypothetical protein
MVANGKRAEIVVGCDWNAMPLIRGRTWGVGVSMRIVLSSN